MVAEPVVVKPLTEKEMEYMVRETKDGRNHFDFDYFHDATKDKSACVTANTHKGVPYNVLAEPVRIGTIENDAKNPDHDSQQYRVYSPDGKSVTLCGNGGGLGAKTGLYATPVAPPMQVNEATKLGYTVIQPGECVDLAMPQSKTRRGRAMKDKTNCLTTSCEFYEYCGTLDAPIYQVRGGMITVKGQEYPIKLRDGCYIIRKLTVRECMRLQTVPETYVFPVSPSQAYKMLGNGWTVDVIAHIMGHFGFCNNYQPCKEVWASGQRVHKYIGYDAGETRRIQHAAPIDEADKKYEKHYPLYEWGWTREECVHVIERAGLPRPGKSSCFFCPSMKKKEIQALWENYPDLFERAIALEHGSAKTNVNVKGLGRMTYERAAEILDPEHRETYESLEIVNEACRMGRAALFRRIPEPPHPDGDESILACPSCGSGEYLHNEDGNRCRFCGWCGQAIDWNAETFKAAGQMKPVLKYPGSKWRLAEWIVSLMPPHKSYLEPFFGSGAVFFKKPPSRIETINDLDGEIINLFRCIREQPEELMRAVAYTPYSRGRV